jgi:hypothetical protein
MRFSNLQMDLVHTVGSQVQSNEVRIDLFEDRECSVPLMNREIYIAVDVFRDLSDDGDGSGTSQVCTLAKRKRRCCALYPCSIDASNRSNPKLVMLFILLR